MKDLTPADVQNIFAKNDQEVTLEQAEEIHDLLKTLAVIAVAQTLRAERKILDNPQLAINESSQKK